MNMKQILICVLVLGLCAMGTGISFAGRGFKGDLGAAPPNAPAGIPAGIPGMKHKVNILDGTPVTITGAVYDSNVLCEGIEIQTGTETVRIYGIGPVWYWDKLGVAMPQAGDDITVNGYKVAFNDETYMTFAMTITVNGVEVKLRDSETGRPLWRRQPPVNTQTTE